MPVEHIQYSPSSCNRLGNACKHLRQAGRGPLTPAPLPTGEGRRDPLSLRASVRTQVIRGQVKHFLEGDLLERGPNSKRQRPAFWRVMGIVS